MKKKPILLNSERGVTATETVVVVGFITLAVIAAGIVFYGPLNLLFENLGLNVSEILKNISDQKFLSGILLALYGGIVGVSVWSVKKRTSSYEFRAQLIIIEQLSQGKEFTRKEIRNLLHKESIIFRLYPSIHIDALAKLVRDGNIMIDNGIYRSKNEKKIILN